MPRAVSRPLPRAPAGDERLRADSEAGEAGLSTIFDTVTPQARAPRAATPGSAFDVCHGGVVLRAVLFVHGVVAISLAFVSTGWVAWLLDVAAAAAAALPATLLWLVVACLSRRWLARLDVMAQWGAAVLLGALCSAAGWSWVSLLALPDAHAGLGVFAPMLAGAAISAAIFHWLRLRAGMQLPATTTARLTELQSRIRPHFLFNTLNSAIALVRADPPKAEEVLEDLAELFRSALTETGQQVTLGEEIELARRYLAIEQVRFGPRLKVHWDLDPAAAPALVPPLLLQPLVENAIRHGLEPRVEGGRIDVVARREGQTLRIDIADTGVGMAPDAQRTDTDGGFGLAQVRERMASLPGGAGSVQVSSQPGQGTTVRLTLPLQNTP